MGRGRPRKSDAQKEIEGNPGRRPLGGEVAVKGAPVRPKRMGKEGGWLWNIVVQSWMSEIDTAELIVLCDTWELLCAATRAAKRDPMNPEIRNSYVRYKAEFDKLAARFGLTPADRSKIRTPSEDSGDDKDKKYFGVVG